MKKLISFFLFLLFLFFILILLTRWRLPILWDQRGWELTLIIFLAVAVLLPAVVFLSRYFFSPPPKKEMPIISPFKRRYYNEAEEEPFSGEDMLPFIANLYQESSEQEEKQEGSTVEVKEGIEKKVDRYFLQRVVKKVFKL